jgi:hypothetical protein
MKQEYEDLPPTVTRRAGVAIEKRPTVVDPDLALVRLRVTARGGGSRIVRLADELPDGTDRENVGFDPELGPDWRFENGEAWFTAVLDGETVETRYGVRGIDHGAVPTLEAAPRIDAVVPVEHRPEPRPTAGD